MTHTGYAASEAIVLYALATRMAIGLCVLLSFAQFLWVPSAVTYAAATYLSIDVETFAKRRRLLLLGPLLFGIILAIAVITFDAFSQK